MRSHWTVTGGMSSGSVTGEALQGMAAPQYFIVRERRQDVLGEG